jgi:hypothetical protein
MYNTTLMKAFTYQIEHLKRCVGIGKSSYTLKKLQSTEQMIKQFLRDVYHRNDIYLD